MKTKLLLLSFLLSFSLASIAQETAGYKTSFVRNSAGSNWFINVGAGASAYFGDFQDDADLVDRVTVAPTISVGKWFSPYWGVRVKGQGGAMHTIYKTDNLGLDYMGHDYYYNVHLDAMWNLANYWGVYSPTKTFNFTPYVGLGFARRLWLDDRNSNIEGIDRDPLNVLTANGGIQFGFRLSDRINLDFDFGATVLPDDFDRVSQGSSRYDAILTAGGGLTFKLGKTTFDVVDPMDQGLVDDLNGKINALRAENDMLSKRPVSCPECPKVAPVVEKSTEINYVPNVVFFRLNSTKVDDNQQVSVYNTAQFMKETGEKIKVVGYADAKTGSDSYNLKISEKRAKAVAKELTEKYGIPSQNIIVEWKGSGEQPYSENSWNRVVIMNAE